MGKNIVEVNESNFKEEVLNADVPVVVDFWAPWCGPCKMIAPVLEELGADFDGKVKIAKVNVDNNQSLAKEYRISSIPNLVFFNDGEIADRHVGFAAKDALASKIENL